MLDLLTIALDARLDRPTDLPPETRRQVLLQHLHTFIEGRLADRDLTPAVVADAHHISLRYLHRLFESEGHSVAALIRQRRLERCRTDLLDPVLAGRTVAATGARWGLANPAQFNRAFRATYGLPPAEFRHTFASRVTRRSTPASDAHPLP